MLQHPRRGRVEGGARAERIVRVGSAGEHLRAHLLVEDVVRIGDGPAPLPARSRRAPASTRCAESTTPAMRIASMCKRDVEILGRHGEEILGHALARVGVEIAAHDAADVGELIGGESRAAAKHHVLLRVRHPGKSLRRLIGAHQVIDRGRDHRRQRIAHDDHPQPVRQRLPRDLRPERIRLRASIAASASAREQVTSRLTRRYAHSSSLLAAVRKQMISGPGPLPGPRDESPSLGWPRKAAGCRSLRQ